MSLQAFLQQNPQLLRSPLAPVEPVREDKPIWQERPDHLWCFCCGGDGLVRPEVMRRFVSADYDPIMSQPVRCDRSEACGYEKQRLHDPEHGDRLLEFHRYVNRVELPTLPRELSDRIHQELKAEYKAIALSCGRAARIVSVREQLQTLGNAFTMPEAKS